MSDELLIDDAGPIATFAFNRPAARNALTLAMLDGLAAGIRRCSARNDLRAIVLRGAGEQPFSAGYSLDQLTDRTLSGEDARAINAPIRAAAEAILACPHPVIAAARKFVFGAALDLFCHCDLRLAVHGTTFCMPPNKFGFMYPRAGTQRLVAIAGLSRATEMLLLAHQVSTEEALRSGLLQRALTAEKFEEEVATICASVAANAPLSMRASKRSLNELAASGTDAAREAQMYEEIAACLNSEDVREGRNAFAEKRQPKFSGK